MRQCEVVSDDNATQSDYVNAPPHFVGVVIYMTSCPERPIGAKCDRDKNVQMDNHTEPYNFSLTDYSFGR